MLQQNYVEDILLSHCISREHGKQMWHTSMNTRKVTQMYVKILFKRFSKS